MVCLAKTYFRNADEGLFQETFALRDETRLITAFSLSKYAGDDSSDYSPTIGFENKVVTVDTVVRSFLKNSLSFYGLVEPVLLERCHSNSACNAGGDKIYQVPYISKIALSMHWFGSITYLREV
jgi:hypothetical protein